MKKYCKGYTKHHNAGHSDTSPLAKSYNDWCCKYSNVASRIIGHCKLNNGKGLK